MALTSCQVCHRTGRWLDHFRAFSPAWHGHDSNSWQIQYDPSCRSCQRGERNKQPISVGYSDGTFMRAEQHRRVHTHAVMGQCYIIISLRIRGHRARRDPIGLRGEWRPVSRRALE